MTLRLYCAECGPVEKMDEDGLCATCGANTFRSDAPWFRKVLRAAIAAKIRRRRKEAKR